MAVILRAMWTSEAHSEPEAFDAMLRVAVAAWAMRADHAEPLQNGEHRVDAHRSVIADSRSNGDMSEWRFQSVDSARRGDTRWVTDSRVRRQGGRLDFLVELQHTSSDISAELQIARPGIVDRLIGLGRNPLLGGTPMTLGAQEFPAVGIDFLVSHLRSTDRMLPVVAFTSSNPTDRAEAEALARKFAKRTVGIAQTVTIHDEAVTRLRDELGQLAVWGGAARVYMPCGLQARDAWRHRYFPGHQMRELGSRTLESLVSTVAQASARRPVPEAFVSDWTPASEDRSREAAELLELADEEHAELSNRFSAVASELADLRADHDELQAAHNLALGRLERLTARLRTEGRESLRWETDAGDADAIPDAVDSVSDAVLAATAYLGESLSIPSGAARDLTKLDASPNASAWGNTTLRGLKALSAYAVAKRSGASGGFWEWCQQSGESGWPATEKKLSMSESETVRSSAKYMAARRFPVDAALSSEGVMEMVSHLKIAQGGGDLAPRVYFFDDTNGSTQKVHVGFVGPHYLVPNTKA